MGPSKLEFIFFCYTAPSISRVILECSEISKIRDLLNYNSLWSLIEYWDLLQIKGYSRWWKWSDIWVESLCFWHQNILGWQESVVTCQDAIEVINKQRGEFLAIFDPFPLLSTHIDFSKNRSVVLIPNNTTSILLKKMSAISSFFSSKTRHLI